MKAKILALADRRASASPTSARRPSSGTATTGKPVCQRDRLAVTGARPTICERAARPRGHETCVRAAHRPACSTRTSPAPSSRWLLDNVPGARARAPSAANSLFGTIDTWLIWNLTGGARTSPTVTNAVAHPALRHPRAATGTTELLDLLGVPRGDAAARSRLHRRCSARPTRRSSGAEVPIAGIAGDQQAALFGQACFAPGMAKNTYGTGCFMLHEHRRRSRSPRATGLLTTIAWRPSAAGRTTPSKAAIFIGGAVVQWLRDGLGPDPASRRDVEALRRSVPDSRRRLPRARLRRPRRAALGPGRPRRASSASRAAPTRAHIVARGARGDRLPDARRARRHGGATSASRFAELRVDGGAPRNDLLMQFQSDILDLYIDKPGHKRNHRPRRLLSRRASRSGSGRSRRSRRCGASTRSTSRPTRQNSASVSTPVGRKPSKPASCSADRSVPKEESHDLFDEHRELHRLRRRLRHPRPRLMDGSWDAPHRSPRPGRPASAEAAVDHALTKRFAVLAELSGIFAMRIGLSADRLAAAVKWPLKTASRREAHTDRQGSNGPRDRRASRQNSLKSPRPIRRASKTATSTPT
ncbi:MAG: FGGY-family carbohydrate kinase [Bacillus subtilis]|nr:FGGY-family carbohydrate kinase [Bacillus subtilis]